MAKKTEKVKLAKPVERSIKIEKKKNKPGRKSLRVPIQSPKPISPRSKSMDDQTYVVKKQRGRKPIIKPLDQVNPIEKLEQNERSEHIGSPGTNSIVEYGINDEAVWQRVGQLNETIQQLKQATINKIEELRDYVNTTIKNPEPIELDPSITEMIRLMISEEISKEFKNQSENFKDNLIETKIKQISNNKKRGRPNKMQQQNSPKSSDNEAIEPQTQKKRGRKKKTLEDLSPEKGKSAKNVSSVAELLDDIKKDFRINNIITFSNLTEQPEARKELIKPIESPKHNLIITSPPKSKIENKSKDLGSSALLPSVPLKSIQALIEDHKSELIDTKKSISSETPVPKTARHINEPLDDAKSVCTEAEGGRNPKKGHDIDIEFDFNAFSLNN